MSICMYVHVCIVLMPYIADATMYPPLGQSG